MPNFGMYNFQLVDFNSGDGAAVIEPNFTPWGYSNALLSLIMHFCLVKSIETNKKHIRKEKNVHTTRFQRP